MPDATVAIVTRNRCVELRRALASAISQRGSVEVLVLDDGSDDGTAEVVRAEFPAVELVRYDSRAGLVVRRNDAARLAQAPIIISLDDDAVFSSTSCVTQTLNDFDDARIGAVAIPFDEIVGDGVERGHRPPEASGRWTAATFRGTAYAVRRDVFLSLGGFREAIVHQGEEPEFCLRLLAAGYVVRLGRADPIYHYPSPSRDLDRMDVYGRRNELLWVFTSFPLPLALPLMAGYAAKGLLLGIRLGRLAAMVRGVGMGIRDCWRLRRERCPLSWKIVVTDRRLRHAGSLRLEDLELQLPEPALLQTTNVD